MAEDETEELADFEEAHAPGGRNDSVKGTQSCDAEEDAHRGASGCGAGWRLVVSTSHDESQKNGTFGVVATCMCDHPSIGKFLRFFITFLCIVAWVCSSTHRERHWPTCFDQTCGHSGEGPLTALDSPDAPGLCLTPTQEIMTCDMDQTQNEREARPENDVQGVWEHPHTHTQWTQVQEMPCMGMQRGIARDVADLHCCRMSGAASHESQSQSCPQGLGSSAAEGTPRLTQGMEQAMDVQMADAQCDPQPPSERVACRAALQVPTAFPAMVAAPMEVESGQPMQINLASPRAGQAEPQGRAEAPDPAAVFS